MLIVFVSGVERGSVSEDACRIVAALVHYFLLVAFLWMLIEAYFMYQAFVKVFRDYGDYVMWKCSVLGWGKILFLKMSFPLPVSRNTNILWIAPQEPYHSSSLFGEERMLIT